MLKHFFFVFSSTDTRNSLPKLPSKHGKSSNRHSMDSNSTCSGGFHADEAPPLPPRLSLFFFFCLLL